MSTSHINKLFQDSKKEQVSYSFDQIPVLAFMDAMGYGDKNTPGMCLGITHMWEQAVICGESENFIDRMVFINNMYHRIAREITDDMKHKGLDPNDVNEFQREFKLRVQNEIVNKLENEKEFLQSQTGKQWQEINIFFSGVDLVQDPILTVKCFQKQLLMEILLLP